MGAAANKGAHTAGGNAQGQRDIAVRRGVAGDDLPVGVDVLGIQEHLDPRVLLFAADIGTGAFTHHLYVHLAVQGGGLGDHRFKAALHIGEASQIIGTVLIQAGGGLRNGVHGRAPGDGTYVKGGLRPFLHRHPDQEQFGNDLRQFRNGVGTAEIPEGVTALLGDGDLVPGRADGAVDHPAVSGVQRYKSFHLFTPGLHQLPGPFQVAQSLFAGNQGKNDAALDGRLILRHIFCHGDDRHRVGGVVTDAGATDDVAVLHQGQGLGIGKHDVGMGGQHVDLIRSLAVVRIHDVQSFICIDAFTAEGFQKRLDPGGSLFLVIRGRGDLRQFQQLFRKKADVFLNKLLLFFGDGIHLVSPYSLMRASMYAFTCVRGMRSWVILSRSRTVTQPSFSVSKS